MATGPSLKKPPGFMDPATPPPPAGAQKPVIPPTFYQTKKEKRNCCRNCCCCICCLIFFLIIIIGILCGLFFAWFQPKVPIFHFSRLELDRFNINVKSDGNSLLDSKAVIRVEANNPNSKLEIYYGDTEVMLNLDEEISLGSATLPGFVQPVNNVTLLKYTLGVNDEVIDSSLALRLNRGMKNDDIEVNAAVLTKVGIGVGKVKIGMLPVNVICKGISLKQLDDGNVSPKCSFNTLRW
ncbi:NDR1/HIN1-like protein 6 [Silene latifolia]|uniref:NDR1/HIN1-like protein 6 n=1 Tax=Silene latifolia TaxID=37657 RepID=UPI003D76E93A